MSLSKVFSQRLREERKRVGLCQRTLAERSGYSETRIRKIERAPNGANCQLQTVEDLAQALGTSPFYLLGGER